MSLRLRAIAVLQQRGEPATYRDLTDLLWSTYPDLRDHLVQHYQAEQKARKEMRIRLGTLVKDYPQTFSAALSDERVLVGLSAPSAELDDLDPDEEDEESEGAKPSVYWYTFPAYQAASGPFPIKIGRGADPLTRIKAQVTAMPEQPQILGTFQHADPASLERALHSVLQLRGKRKQDAPGAEWFMTTPDEISALIRMVLGT